MPFGVYTEYIGGTIIGGTIMACTTFYDVCDASVVTKPEECNQRGVDVLQVFRCRLLLSSVDRYSHLCVFKDITTCVRIDAQGPCV